MNKNVFLALSMLALAVAFQNCADVHLLPNTRGEQNAGSDDFESFGKVLQIVGSGAHRCILLENKTVRCWGDNREAQLATEGIDFSSTPVEIEGLSNVSALAAGDSHTCALLSDEKLKCWGSNYAGQLGDGTQEDRYSPTQVIGLSGVKKVFAGGSQSCALLAGGRAKCWGNNLYDRLGTGETWEYGSHYITNPTSVKINGSEASGFKEISLGGHHHSCGLRDDNTLSCWGSLAYLPAVDSFQNVKQVSSAVSHTCVLFEEGKVKCWGRNEAGELGRGITSSGQSTEALYVKGIDNVGDLTDVIAIQVSSLQDGVSCALLANREVVCWGANTFGILLGDGTNVTHRSFPNYVKAAEGNLIGVDAISLGSTSACVLLDAKNRVECWGYNIRGQLGNGGVVNAALPEPVVGFAN